MKKLNRKGYLTVEIILASVITFVIAFFLIDLTMKLVDVVNNAYADIVLTTDKSLIVKNVREYLSKDMSLNGNISSVSCSQDGKNCDITMNNGNVATLSLNGNQLKYSDSNKKEIYSKQLHDSLSNISLSSSTESGYYNFKIFGENIFMDKDYEMNINVYNKSVPIFAPSNTWYKGKINKNEITKINFFDNYSEYENYINQTGYIKREEWPAAFTADSNKLSSEIMCYINGTELSIVGNGTGKIYANQNASNMFGGYGLSTENRFLSLISIEGLELLDTSMATNMRAFFCFCENLKSVDLSSFDTSKVTDIAGFFVNCYMLEDVNLSSFDTQMVTDIRNMFSGCMTLKMIDISSLDITAKITNMKALFQKCQSLETIVWPDKIDTTNVTSMNHLFYECFKLTNESINALSKFNTENVSNMQAMFYKCSSLTSFKLGNDNGADLANFNTKKVKDMRFMFNGCTGLTKLDLSGFDTSSVIHMSAMFQGCSSLNTLNISSFDTSNVWEMMYLFNQCESLSNLELGSFDTGCVKFMRAMFHTAMNVKTIYVSDGWNIDGVLIADNMFSNTISIQGEKNTNFDWDYIDKTYARIDEGISLPGYFTTSNIRPLNSRGNSECSYLNEKDFVVDQEPHYSSVSDYEEIEGELILSDE